MYDAKLIVEEETGRFPKILVFACNDLDHVSYANQVVKICKELFNRGDDFVQKITGKVDRPLQKIREFRNRSNPAISNEKSKPDNFILPCFKLFLLTA
jgi:type I restriction enzyme R subunit